MYATAECTLKEVKASRLDLEYTLKEVTVRSTIDHLHRSPSEPLCVFFLFLFLLSPTYLPFNPERASPMLTHQSSFSLVVSPSLLTPSKLCLLAVP